MNLYLQANYICISLTSTNMRLATPNDKPFIINTISQAFHDNKSTNYVVKPGSNAPERIKELVDYCFKMCESFGEIWISDDEQACALVMLPHKKKTTLKAILWDAKLATKAIGLSRVGKVMARESAIKKNHPKEPFAYLWYIGTVPKNQGRGSGTRLLKEINGYYRKQKLAVHLETSTTRNLPWYDKHGYQVYNEIDFGYPLYMLRLPLN